MKTDEREQRHGKPWYRQFWPWFLVALPLASMIISFVTLSLAISHADVVLPTDDTDRASPTRSASP